MGFFQQITEKPWEAGDHRVVGLYHRAFFLPSATLGLRLLFAAITVLFSLLLVAYHDRMMMGGDWRALSEPWLLWPNTAVLIASSAGMQWASVSGRQGDIRGVRRGLLLGGASAFLFLVGQLLAWQQLVDLGYFATENPANAFFYLLTGLHGLHLLGGLVAWSWASDRAWRRDAAPERLRLGVELCATYWHFLLAVWLILFALLLLT